MLVLSRRKNQSIVIGDAVVIHIAEVRGNRVRLAIEAPQDIPVVRSELVEVSVPQPANFVHAPVATTSETEALVATAPLPTVIRSVSTAPFRTASLIMSPRSTAFRRRRPR